MTKIASRLLKSERPNTATNDDGKTTEEATVVVYRDVQWQLHTEAYLGKRPSLPLSLQPKGVSAVALLKANVGVMEHIMALGSVPNEVINETITAKTGDKSEAPLSWCAREGSMEFHWPEL